MTAPSNDELNLPAAKAVLSLLRLYMSTRSHPKDMPPAAMRRAASTYTGRLYATRHHEAMAIQDLEEWINEREKSP
jgi:hypothetical protein